MAIPNAIRLSSTRGNIQVIAIPYTDTTNAKRIIRKDLGQVVLGGAKRLNKIMYRITIRYGNEIKPDDIIIWRGRKLKILTVPVDIKSRHIWLQFDCEEEIQDGANK